MESHTAPEDTGTPRWVTIGEAADLLDVSAKTVRRRVKAGEIAAELRHDPSIGGERWFIDADRLPRPPGTAPLPVPVEVLETIEALHAQLTEAIARATRAEVTAEFQSARRSELEGSFGELRAEAERLRAELEAERARRWWQRRR